MKQVIENPQPIIEKIELKDINVHKIYIAIKDYSNFIFKLHLHFYEHKNVEYYIWDSLNDTDTWCRTTNGTGNFNSPREAIQTMMNMGYNIYEFDSKKELGKWLDQLETNELTF